MTEDNKNKMRELGYGWLVDLPLQEQVKIWGEAYRVGAKAYDENPEARKEIEAINKQIYAHVEHKTEG